MSNHHELQNLHPINSGLSVDSKSSMTELWEELDDEQLEALAGGEPWPWLYEGRVQTRYGCQKTHPMSRYKCVQWAV
jgi:hypothetical protein